MQKSWCVLLLSLLLFATYSLTAQTNNSATTNNNNATIVKFSSDDEQRQSKTEKISAEQNKDITSNVKNNSENSKGNSIDDNSKCSKHFHGYWDPVVKHPVIEEILPDGTKRIVHRKKPIGKGNDFNIIPNPATNLIKISGAINYSIIKIFNLSGSCVLTKTFNSPQGNNTEINISDLPPGRYIMEIGDNHATFIKE